MFFLLDPNTLWNISELDPTISISNSDIHFLNNIFAILFESFELEACTCRLNE